MAETISEMLKKQRDSLARVQTIGGKNYIGYFNAEFFFGIRTNNVSSYISQRLRGKELKMQIPEQQSTVVFFDDEDLISFDDCMQRLDRAVKIQESYALADVFDNQCEQRNIDSDN
jgi:hypothetical protein